MPVSLEARQTELPGIGRLDPERWYRAHGAAGLDDFLREGVVRANPNGKYPSTYYSQGAVDNRYMPRGRGAIVEALDGVEDIGTSQYGITERSKPLTKANRIRMWQLANGAYSPVYDNITPWKYGLRTAGRVASNALGAVGAVGGLLDAAELANEYVQALPPNRTQHLFGPITRALAAQTEAE